MKIISFLFCLIFLTSFSSSLQIIGESTFHINKTIDEDYNITFELKNDRPVDFVNITFEPNEHIIFNEVLLLAPGQVTNVTGIIKSNSDIDKDFIIKGYYETNTGSSYDTHTVEINSDTSRMSKCDFTIIEGDTVLWENKISYNITLKDIRTPHTFEQYIGVGESYQKTFDFPQTFTYSPWRLGSEYHEPCIITVIDGQGLVHNPDYDTFIHLDIDPKYESTSVNINILQLNHIIDFNSEQEGLILIENNGSNWARDIKLNGDWFDFTLNNFDLGPGLTKSVVYKIKPQIFNTGQTNKSYNKTINIEGNFETYEKNFNIFVNYANIQNSEEGNILGMPLEQFLDGYLQSCVIYPNHERCQRVKEKVFITINDSIREFNVTWNLEKVNAIEELVLNTILKQAEQYKTIMEVIDKIDNRSINTENITRTSSEYIGSVQQDIRKRNDLNSYFLAMFVVGAIATFILYFYRREKRKNKNNITTRW